MRLELLYSPRLLIERLAIESQRFRRLGKLQRTPANKLKLGYIDSLELLEITKSHHPKVIYDVGANIGTWSLLAKAILPQATIHAFEPLAMHYEIFEREMQNVPDIKLHKIALGASSCTLNMQITSFSDASSLLPIAQATEDIFGVFKEKEEEVEVIRLDNYILDNQLPLPDLIKLDIQGYELEALKGAQECLRHAKYIITEVSFLEFYEGQPLFHNIAEFLRERNFYLHALGTNTSLGKELSQTDILFIRK